MSHLTPILSQAGLLKNENREARISASTSCPSAHDAMMITILVDSFFRGDGIQSANSLLGRYRFQMRSTFWLTLAVLAVLALAACGDAATATPRPTSTPAPTPTPVPQINEVSFAAIDFGYTGPSSIPAGMTRISLANQGQELHHQQLIKLPDGTSSEDLLAAFAQGPGSLPPPGIESAGGVSVLAPGGSGTATLNIQPGNYVMLCFVPNAEGVPHFALGQAASLTVTEATGPLAAEPDSDLTVDMSDFAYSLSEPITAGVQTIKVTNGGVQDHEAFLVQLAPGATAMDFLAAFEPGAQGPPPGLPLGGFQSIVNGGGGFFTAEFAPGNFALICFVEDVETGAPHAVLGMIEEFTVS